MRNSSNLNRYCVSKVQQEIFHDDLHNAPVDRELLMQTDSLHQQSFAVLQLSSNQIEIFLDGAGVVWRYFG